MLKLIYIFDHVLIVKRRCYGRCYVKNLIPLSTFLKFHTHREENLVRSFQNVFDKSSRVLILAFPRNWIFHGQPHILGYHSPLRSSLYNQFPSNTLFGKSSSFNSTKENALGMLGVAQSDKK